MPFPWDRLLPKPAAKEAELIGPSTTGVDGFYYYLVEIEAPDGSKPVAVIIDAHSFKMLATAAIPAPAPVVPLIAGAAGFDALKVYPVDPVGPVDPFVAPGMDALGRVKLEETTSRMVGRNFLLNGKEITIEEDPTEKTRTVWEHNRLSMSLFAPYYQIPVDTESIYVRIDDPTLAQRLSLPITEVIDLSGYSGLYTKWEDVVQKGAASR